MGNTTPELFDDFSIHETSSSKIDYFLRLIFIKNAVNRAKPATSDAVREKKILF